MEHASSRELDERRDHLIDMRAAAATQADFETFLKSFDRARAKRRG